MKCEPELASYVRFGGLQDSPLWHIADAGVHSGHASGLNNLFLRGARVTISTRNKVCEHSAPTKTLYTLRGSPDVVENCVIEVRRLLRHHTNRLSQ